MARLNLSFSGRHFPWDSTKSCRGRLGSFPDSSFAPQGRRLRDRTPLRPDLTGLRASGSKDAASTLRRPGDGDLRTRPGELRWETRAGRTGTGLAAAPRPRRALPGPCFDPRPPLRRPPLLTRAAARPATLRAACGAGDPGTPSTLSEGARERRGELCPSPAGGLCPSTAASDLILPRLGFLCEEGGAASRPAAPGASWPRRPRGCGRLLAPPRRITLRTPGRPVSESPRRLRCQQRSRRTPNLGGVWFAPGEQLQGVRLREVDLPSVDSTRLAPSGAGFRTGTSASGC
ncbi:uncharacterized protein LOC111816024 [Octodon degus]|uniref:Uncharacterized protein LOC111816024 n=1 Tax=Octodon degus TaxID=10160 RepID=A0A6P6E7T6_OCTDE|nr:uncharacterized protein LOC111816024 [Octodon degus]